MPIAIHMQQLKFRYGDFVAREGQIPPGLFMIKSGICKVAKNRIMKRALKPETIPGCKKPILDKNKLFYKYDYENTILQGPKSQVKSF
jgi:hypothetical protein